MLLFNYVLEKEVWPERWGTGVIFPLHKHDSRLDPSNYRPITLLSAVGKLFGSIITARLTRFSESTGSLCDEQGGFRPQRGTPDQVFILREILASRKERGIPTFATYIDVRKAYDTVWREQAYVQLHDAGLRGKLWRQLQQMHQGLSRRVQHPLGLTDWFDVERGVAQGAVESPWVYAHFIEGLASELRARGFGVMVAGRRVPLLMYADDIVMLASSRRELTAMNEVATGYARKNRFQFNGEKSAVMLFNVHAAAKAAADAAHWTLGGQAVEVRDSYEYLGTITPADGLSWTAHVRSSVDKAKLRSADLLWICRSDKGMRPRTAYTLWMALVRPLLEYASEVWGRQIPAYLAEQAERVQTTFLRGTLGLHVNGSGVSDDALRAEVGAEPLLSRWDKLKLGFWWRIFSSPPGRLLRVVAEQRHRDHVGSGGLGFGRLGWMPSALAAMRVNGLDGTYWAVPQDAARLEQWRWRKVVYEAVDAASDESRAARLAGVPSARAYTHIKCWDPSNPRAYSFSVGEAGRWGRLVPERYLDDRRDLKGTRLKLLCRLGCLPVMLRIGREVKPKWPRESRLCLACSSGEVESVSHFVMSCPLYADKRRDLIRKVRGVLGASVGELDAASFEGLSTFGQELVLLGRRFGDPAAEDRIDGMVKRFLTKAWNMRALARDKINSVLGTSYDVFDRMPRQGRVATS